MGRRKSENESDTITLPEGRQRVTMACQRCRLKKSKCDGSSPCCRCKAVDAICAYGIPKKSDKMVYRRGYVQMLERQHKQLIRGVHAMYTHLLNGDEWPGAKLEVAIRLGGKPSTHQILESLGILQTTPQEEAEDTESAWQPFDEHHLDDGLMYTATAISPTTQAKFSPLASTSSPPTLPPSPITVQRPTKGEIDPMVKEHYMAGIPLLTPLPPDWTQDPPFGPDMAYPIQHQPQFSSYQFDDTLGLSGGNGTSGGCAMMNIDWRGTEDTLDSHPARA